MSFFCHLPWTAAFVGEKLITPCCAYTQSDRSKLDTFENYFQSQELAEVKASLLNGQAPKQCLGCVKSEAETGHSFRLLHNKFHDEKTQEILEKGTDHNITMELQVLTSNTCNLLCLPCGGQASYARGVELNKLGLSKRISPHFKKNSILDDVHKFNFKHITFLGGEPFGDKVTFECLETLVRHDKSKDIVLDLNTNCTLLDQKNLDFLSKNFKFVNIKASIDGIGTVNDYLRYPSNWADLQSRVLLTRDYSNMNLMVTTALSNLSLIKYHQIIEWAIDNQIKDLFVTTVEYPKELAAGNLPTDIKNQLLEIYLNLKDHYSTHQQSDRIGYVLDTCINICKSSNNAIFNQTMTWLQTHDQHRKNSVLEVFPELRSYAQV